MTLLDKIGSENRNVETRNLPVQIWKIESSKNLHKNPSNSVSRMRLSRVCTNCMCGIVQCILCAIVSQSVCSVF